MDLRISLSHPRAEIPQRAPGSDGYDLVATEILDDTPQYIEYGTGVHVEIPKGYFGCLRPRSSISKMDLVLVNGPGTIDHDYRGEIRVRFKKIRPLQKGEFGEYIVPVDTLKLYRPWERVAQILFLPVAHPTLIVCDDLSDTDRGAGGFGSTGK
jgi:dUTP pyrophosphatase